MRAGTSAGEVLSAHDREDLALGDVLALAGADASGVTARVARLGRLVLLVATLVHVELRTILQASEQLAHVQLGRVPHGRRRAWMSPCALAPGAPPEGPPASAQTST